MKRSAINSIEPFAKLYSEMHRIVELMEGPELRQLIKHLDLPTRSNCWWAIYDVAPIIKKIAIGTARSRARNDKRWATWIKKHIDTPSPTGQQQ